MRPSLRRPFALVGAVLLGAAIAFPLGALASHQFADVPDSNLYHNDIDALVDSGVTSGCGGGNYCPSANVTREQMAAFLNRLGALAPGKTPVVNADKLDGLDSTQFIRADVPSEGHFLCAADAFQPRDSGLGYAGGGQRYTTSTSGTFICPAQLPDGATVTAIRADITDTTTTGAAQCSLIRYALFANEASVEMAQTTLAPITETPGRHTITDNTIESPVVDTTSHVYVAQCYVSASFNPLVNGLAVDYTATGLRP